MRIAPRPIPVALVTPKVHSAPPRVEPEVAAPIGFFGRLKGAVADAWRAVTQGPSTRRLLNADETAATPSAYGATQLVANLPIELYPGFRSLAPGVQGACRFWQASAQGEGKAALAWLLGDAAFAAVPPAKQQQLLGLLCNDVVGIGQAARAAYKSLPVEPRERIAQLVRLIDETPPGWRAFRVPDEVALARPRQPVTIRNTTEPRLRPDVTGQPQVSTLTWVRVGESVVRVFDFDPIDGHDKLSLTEWMEVLSYLTPEQLTHLQVVNLQGRRDPSDVHLAKVYDSPGYATAMTAQPNKRTVNVFLRRTLGRAVTTLYHEVGHLRSMGEHGSTGPFWTAWREAGWADGLSCSGYSRTDLLEDFAEIYALVHLHAGRPEATQIAAMFPNRIALMRKYGYLPT